MIILNQLNPDYETMCKCGTTKDLLKMTKIVTKVTWNFRWRYYISRQWSKLCNFMNTSISPEIITYVYDNHTFWKSVISQWNKASSSSEKQNPEYWSEINFRPPYFVKGGWVTKIWNKIYQGGAGAFFPIPK